MLGRLKSARPSPALIVALVALFISIGGVGYAAATIGSAQIKNNSIRGKDIRNSTITGKDVKNNSLSGADILESKLGKVPSASSADSARLSGVQIVTANGTAPGAGTPATATATCPAGTKVVGGGGQVADPNNEFVNDMWPSSATAYTVRVFNTSGGGDLGFIAYAICAPSA